MTPPPFFAWLVLLVCECLPSFCVRAGTGFPSAEVNEAPRAVPTAPILPSSLLVGSVSTSLQVYWFYPFTDNGRDVDQYQVGCLFPLASSMCRMVPHWHCDWMPLPPCQCPPPFLSSWHAYLCCGCGFRMR